MRSPKPHLAWYWRPVQILVLLLLIATAPVWIALIAFYLIFLRASYIVRQRMFHGKHPVA